MSSIWNYEPFYDIEHFLDNALTNRVGSNSTNDTAVARRSGNDPNAEGAMITALKPRMDLREDHKKNIVTATFELPGMKKEDVNVDVHDNRLTVSGESRMFKEHEKGSFAIKERRYGKFSRTLQLPHGVQEDQIQAHLDNGVLSVEFPKSSPKHAHKRIAIN